MVMAHVLATQIQKIAAHPYSLTIAGVDVIKQPGATGNGYGTLLSTIAVTEAAYGQVSSLQATVEDPLGVLNLIEGSEVRMWDHTRDEPVFLGFLQSWSLRPSGIGRSIDIVCVGIEAILDWMLVPAVTFGALTLSFTAQLQALVASAYSVGVPLRAFAAVGGNSTIATPIEDSGGLIQSDTTIPDGTTLREAIRMVNTTWLAVTGLGSLFPGITIVTTVDFYYGLRNYIAWDTSAHSDIKLVPGVMTVSVAAGRIATDIQHEIDTGTAYHQVFIKGGNAAGSGLVTDGTGLPGPIGYYSAVDSLTEQNLADTGLGWLASNTATIRGRFTLDGNVQQVSTMMWRPRAVVTLTDPTIGTITAPIGQITKRWTDAAGDLGWVWDITYGRSASPSAAQLLRRFTRTANN